MKYRLKAWQWQAEVHTHTEENVAAVEDLTLSQKGRPHTRYRETGLSKSSVVAIICLNLGLKCLKRNAQEPNKANCHANGMHYARFVVTEQP